MPEQIFHITTKQRWEEMSTLDWFDDESLRNEGFIHCSTRDQILIPANERFHGTADLVLLSIDPARLSAPLRYEDCYQTGFEFPHVYGAIDVAAVIDVINFPCQPDGSFLLPAEI